MIESYDAWAAAVAALNLGLSLMAVVLLPLTRRWDDPHLWLQVLLCAGGLSSLGDALYHLDADIPRRVLNPFTTSALLLLGPALWLYARALASRGGSRFAVALHVLPSAVAFCLLAIAAAFSPASPRTPTRSMQELLSLIPIALQMACYGIALFRHIGRVQQALPREYSELSHRDIRWLRRVFGLYILTLLVWVLSWQWLTAWSNLMTNSILVVTTWLLAAKGGQQQQVDLSITMASNFPAVPSEPNTSATPYKKARLTGTLAEEIGQGLKKWVDEGELYRNPDLTLGQLAEQLGTSAHQLSHYFSQHLNQSFYDYINQRRVEAVKRSIQTPGNASRTLLDIALECGFGSKSTFNAAFRRVTGMSPTEFRKNTSEPTG